MSLPKQRYVRAGRYTLVQITPEFEKHLRRLRRAWWKRFLNGVALGFFVMGSLIAFFVFAVLILRR
jgi:hypothetical protein